MELLPGDVYCMHVNPTAKVAPCFSAEVSNRTTKIRPLNGISPSVALSKFFGYWDKNSYWIRRATRGRASGFKSLMRYGRVGTGLFIAQFPSIRKAGIRFEVSDELRRVRYNADPKWSDRQFQNEVVRAMKRTPVGGLVINATGTGKTMVTGLYLRKVRGRAIFVVDELSLLYQAREELERVVGETIGVIGDSEWSPSRITVCTIQTLGYYSSGEPRRLSAREKARLTRVERRLERKRRRRIARRNLERFLDWARTVKVAILDEVHTALNRRSLEVIQRINPRLVFGLTATLQLKKKEVRLQAYNLCGPVLYEYPLTEGQREGYLALAVAVSVDCHTPFWGPKRSVYKAVITEQRRIKLVADVVRYAVARGLRTIVLVERIQHVHALSKELLDIQHGVVYGKIKKDLRLEYCRQFEKGEILTLISSRVFKKGINLKSVGCIVDAAAMGNENDVLQKLGRGVRMWPFKDGLVYVDISDRGNQLEKRTKKRIGVLKRAGVPVIRARRNPEEALSRARKKLLLMKEERKDGITS